MRVGIDLRPMESHSKGRGIGYYNLNLFSRVLKNPASKNFILYTKFFSDLPKSLTGNFWKVPIVLRPVRAVRKFDPLVWFFWLLALRIKKPQLLHITSLFEVYYLSVPKNIPTVVTIYDLIPMLFDKQFFDNEKARDWYIRRLNQVKKAVKVITISESAKKDIMKILKIPSNKIEVVYCGIDERFIPVDKSKARKILKEKYEINQRFVLSVGSTTINKNIPAIFESFKVYTTENQVNDLKLVVVCKLESQEKRHWQKRIKQLGMEEKIIFTNFVPDKDIPVFYSGAEVLLFPSIYEGFGLPVAEAMACGCPVITSNTSSLPEVGGKAAVYVNPLSIESIVKGLEKVLEDKNLQKKMIKEGLKQSRKFNWEKSAEQTIKIYQDLVRPSVLK